MGIAVFELTDKRKDVRIACSMPENSGEILINEWHKRNINKIGNAKHARKISATRHYIH